ncbi:MAG: 4,5-DOPA dioxygenase extradiol, partial [Bacteroidota bacterium]
QSLAQIRSELLIPQAIMVVSAHWETQGTYVSVNPLPKTIHDFGRFDDRLFEIDYPAKGHPELATEVAALGQDFHVQTDHRMGLDHGAWTVLRFMYPEADIPVFQLSLDYTKSASYHFELAKALRALRQKGVLVVGSGNLVHNLRILDWQNIEAQPFDWAVEFDALAKTKLDKRDFQALVHYQKLGALAQMAIPTPDHYLPLLYTLGLAEANEPLRYLFEGLQYGSISMRCFRVG